jgi:hypothetical protein
MTDVTGNQFLAWQCRIRQIALRKHNGVPQPGMMPQFRRTDGSVLTDSLTVLIIHSAPETATSEFRHIIKRTHDPQKRMEDGIKLLSTLHYQYPDHFSDRMTALFAEGSGMAPLLQKEGAGQLVFNQFSQNYTVPCSVDRLETQDPAWQATFWHNHLFNPNLSEACTILAFTPDWSGASYSSGET